MIHAFKRSAVGVSLAAILCLSASSVYAQHEGDDGSTTTLTNTGNGGFLVNLVDARGVETVLEYSKENQLLSESANEKGRSEYEYDGKGRKTVSKNPGDARQTYEYDELNRLVLTVAKETGKEKISTRYTYDTCENGIEKLCKVRHDSHITRYTYQEDGQLSKVTVELSDEDDVETLLYRYHEDGKLKSMRYPSGLKIRYFYDDQGRVTRLVGQYETGDSKERFTLVDNISYDSETGALTGFTHGNGLRTTFSLLDNKRLSSIKVEDSGQLVDERTLSYNLDGLISKSDRPGTELDSMYVYENGRLVQEQIANDDSVTNYEHDAVGNRLSRTIDGRKKRYTYATNSNRMTAIGNKSVAYDLRGNMIEDREGTRQFEYDATNRMSAFYKEGTLRATYDYDANGRRIRKILHSTQSDSAKSLRFTYNTDGQLISETTRRDDRSKLRAKDIVWLDGMPVAQINRKIKSNGNTKKVVVSYLHVDHVGAPREARSSDGTLVWAWRGDAFGAGETLRDPDGDGTKTEISLRFPGQYADRESGLFYNNKRDYDPNIGRYIQSDPIGLEGGANRYTYVSGDPVNKIDPLGLYEECTYLSCNFEPGYFPYIPTDPGPSEYERCIQSGACTNPSAPPPTQPRNPDLVGSCVGLNGETLSDSVTDCSETKTTVVGTEYPPNVCLAQSGNSISVHAADIVSWRSKKCGAFGHRVTLEYLRQNQSCVSQEGFPIPRSIAECNGTTIRYKPFGASWQTLPSRDCLTYSESDPFNPGAYSLSRAYTAVCDNYGVSSVNQLGGGLSAVPSASDPVRGLGPRVGYHSAEQVNVTPSQPETPTSEDQIPASEIQQAIDWAFNKLSELDPDLQENICNVMKTAMVGLRTQSNFAFTRYNTTILSVEGGAFLTGVNGSVVLAYAEENGRGALGIFVAPGVGFADPTAFRDPTRVTSPSDIRRLLFGVQGAASIGSTNATRNELMDPNGSTISTLRGFFRHVSAELGFISVTDDNGQDATRLYAAGGVGVGGLRVTVRPQIGYFIPCPVRSSTPSPTNPRPSDPPFIPDFGDLR